MPCLVMWGLFSAMVSFMHNSICPPEMKRKPQKTACGCPCGRVTKRVTHSQSPHLLKCTYSYMYQMTPGVFRCRMLQQQQQHQQHLQLMCLKMGESSILVVHCMLELVISSFGQCSMLFLRTGESTIVILNHNGMLALGWYSMCLKMEESTTVFL